MVVSQGTAGRGQAGLRVQLPQLISFPPRSTICELVHGFGSNTSTEKGFLWVLGGGWFMGVINRLFVKVNQVSSVVENVNGTLV